MNAELQFQSMTRWWNKILGAVLLVTAAVTAVTARADDTAEAPGGADTLATIVSRHASALGGLDRVHRVQSFVELGWYREGSLYLAHTYVAQMRPFYRVIGDPDHALSDIHEGYDGSAWEYYPDPGIVVRTVGDAARAARHSAMFDDPLIDAAAHGTILGYGGTQLFRGSSEYVVHVTLVDGFKEDLLVNARTYLIDVRAQIVPMHAFGRRPDTYDVFEDYRPEGGVMMAHHFLEIDVSKNVVLDENGITNVEINPSLSPAIFSPPQWNRTPLQTMLQRIYDEREDPGAIVATYHQFRPLIDVAAASTGEGVDFVGYQCLKMGHADSAVALLALNVEDHPASARDHFGFGRALEASGDRARAQAEYVRALQIDPSFDRASEALRVLQSTSPRSDSLP